MGCSAPPGSARPSIVVILAPSHCSASSVQDLAAMPSRWMTQAPHCEVSQPTWVPVSRKCSRRNCTSKVRSSTLPVTALPFTVMDTAGMASSQIRGQKPSFCRAQGGRRRRQVQIRADFDPNAPWNRNKSEPRAPPGSSDSKGGFCSNDGDGSSARCNHGGKILEKIVGNLLGRPVYKALAELGELAADLGLDIVGEQRAAVLFGQRDRGAALGKAGHAAIALAGNPVAIGRIEVGQIDLAFKARLDRADLGDGNGRHFSVRGLDQLFAAGNTGLEHLGV